MVINIGKINTMFIITLVNNFKLLFFLTIKMINMTKLINNPSAPMIGKTNLSIVHEYAPNISPIKKTLSHNNKMNPINTQFR
ncbi:hypothetical protein CN373_07100 [Bacillus cereus]|uniref:Uncharacterized protein n=1 Tax=Bacillus cereus TaxID=1396 RepID=A0AA44TCL1_BACCE|nr:hypothetical protein CN373_07100 [Bacillus cereus]PFN06598.1 hypothetical protein COJ55_13805 [Bacillus cereus]PFO77131.1 hypothetical protein COJ77_23680 [Bacillus cereus]PFR17292.1 hypothetical protein COK19_24905 [Bacillus cereus]PFR90700.1 hypothetical protein COK38_23360 [Bacillus cereus]